MKSTMPSPPFNAVDVRSVCAASATALYTSVTCDLQCDLSKVAPCYAASEHASTTVFNTVGGRVFQWKTRARARACGIRGGSGPPRRYVGSTRVGGPDGREEVPDPYGGSAPSAVGSSPDLSQSGERVRGRWPGEVRA